MNYFKKLRYCSFGDCLKIANFKDESNYIKNIVKLIQIMIMLLI